MRRIQPCALQRQGALSLAPHGERQRRPDPRPDLSSSLLRIEPCSRGEARAAMEAWHYLGTLPAITITQFGVFERDRFIGAVAFGPGARCLSRSFPCGPSESCELIRVALDRHDTPVSRIVSIALRLLRQSRPHMRLVVSYADTSRGHHGGIYQAGGWTYVGSVRTHAYRVHGRIVHGRTLGSRYGTGGQSVEWLRTNVDPMAERVDAGIKHRYFLGLDPAMRDVVRSMAKPFPKRDLMRAKQAMAGSPGTAAGRH